MSHASTWTDCLGAAHRKFEIATYHRDCLAHELASSDRSKPKDPPAPIQAHFEGVVFSVIAAVDQVAQAINSARNLGLKATGRTDRAFGSLRESIPAVRDWYDDKFGRDLYSIRTRAIHYSYAKTLSGLDWVVESVGNNKDYGGSRALLSYASAAVAYGEKLVELMPEIEQALARTRLRLWTKNNVCGSPKLPLSMSDAACCPYCDNGLEF